MDFFQSFASLSNKLQADSIKEKNKRFTALCNSIRNSCTLYQQYLNGILEGKENGWKDQFPIVCGAFHRLASVERSNQRRRIWANDIYNAYYASQTGIKSRLLDLQDFLEYEQQDVETPQMRAALIRSNYVGNLEYALSRLSPPPSDTDDETEPSEGKLREEQLTFIGWKPIQPKLYEALQQVNAMRFDAKQYQSDYNRLTLIQEETDTYVQRAFRENKEKWNAVKDAEELQRYDIQPELAIYNAVQELLQCGELRRLRGGPDELGNAENVVEDAMAFLTKAFALLPDIDSPTAGNDEPTHD